MDQRAAAGSTLLALVAAAALIPPVLDAQPGAEPAPRPFLRKVIQLTDAQLAAMDRGEVVTKQLATSEKAEVAAFGVVEVSGTLEALRERMRDFQSFRKVPQIVQIGAFSHPPKVEDLQGLTIDDKDLDALRECKPGDCDVKGGTQTLDRLKKEVNWSAPDARAKATAIAKEQMVKYVAAYLAGGTDAMGVTVDKSQPKALSAEFKTLLRNSPYLVEYVPPFHSYVESYPKATLADTTDTVFWAKDTFGLKPVVSIYHATVHTQKTPRPALIAAVKTLYATHYFNAALEVLAATPTADGSGIYVLDLYRARIDPPTGMLSGMLLGKVKSGVEEGVAMNLKNAKARVEAK